MNALLTLCVAATIAYAVGGHSVAAATPGAAPATASFFGNHEEGWFWYQIDPEPEPEPPPEEPPRPQTVVITPPPTQSPEQPAEKAADKPSAFSAAWIRDNIPKYLDRATDSASEDDVRAFLYVQRVMMDKAQRFAEVSQRVVNGDPYIDEVARRPINTADGSKMNEVAGRNLDELLRKISGIAGIWFFYRSDCPYCISEAPVLKSMERLYGIKSMPISLDGLPLPNGEYPKFLVNAGQAEQLSVQVTPALFLVRPPNDVIVISQGSLSLTEMRERIAISALRAGWIGEDDWRGTQPHNHVNPLDEGLGSKPPADIDISDPRKLVDYLRSNVRAK